MLTQACKFRGESHNLETVRAADHVTYLVRDRHQTPLMHDEMFESFRHQHTVE